MTPTSGSVLLGTAIVAYVLGLATPAIVRNLAAERDPQAIASVYRCHVTGHIGLTLSGQTRETASGDTVSDYDSVAVTDAFVDTKPFTIQRVTVSKRKWLENRFPGVLAKDENWIRQEEDGRIFYTGNEHGRTISLVGYGLLEFDTESGNFAEVNIGLGPILKYIGQSYHPQDFDTVAVGKCEERVVP